MNKILHGTLTKKLVELILLAAAVSTGAFFLLNWAADKAVEGYAGFPAYIDREYDRAAGSLQDYVTENELKLADAGRLADWVKGEKSVQIHVFYGEEQLYTSNGVYYETEAGEAKSNEGTGRYYDLPFADGTAKVYIYGAFEYKFYVAVELVLFGLSILLFFILLLLGIRDRIHYIRVLEGDIGVMEGGELQKPVTVQGDDELGTLAEKLEAMRLSLLHQGEAERRATEANRSLVTEMSHDLRTPLTSLLLYTQIVQNGKYKSEAELQSYLEKIYGRAMQIKSQSDALFYHFLVDKDAAPAPLCDEDLKAVFPDVLSDFVCTLEAKGFKVETTGEWPDAKSRVNIEYLTRIMDNLLSNILKYADSGVPVRLLFFCRDGQFSVELYNRIVKRHRTGDSSHIGMENVRSLMERMGGSYEHEEADGIFCSRLLFPCD